MAGNFLAGDFLAHAVTFGDFMAGNFLAGDFLARIRTRLSKDSVPHLAKLYFTIITLSQAGQLL